VPPSAASFRLVAQAGPSGSAAALRVLPDQSRSLTSLGADSADSADGRWCVEPSTCSFLLLGAVYSPEGEALRCARQEA